MHRESFGILRRYWPITEREAESLPDFVFLPRRATSLLSLSPRYIPQPQQPLAVGQSCLGTGLCP